MLTVVFATHNGAETLPLTLESMTRMMLPEGGWKLIAVDNASTDDTPAILGSYRERLPLQILHQPRRGKNISLNMAIPHFQGDLVVFTDDDVIPREDWLALYAAVARREPEVDVFGGRILPHWPDPEPADIINSIPLVPAFAIHPQDVTDGPVNPVMIWGANMAIRRSIFEKGFRFNETIGPASGNYIMGSETELTQRLAGAGFRNFFSNSIIVKHQILDHQLTPKWLWKRAQKFGNGTYFQILNGCIDEMNVKMICNLPRWRIRVLMRDTMLLMAALMKNNRLVFLKSLWNISENMAILRNYFIMNKKKGF